MGILCSSICEGLERKFLRKYYYVRTAQDAHAKKLIATNTPHTQAA